MKASIQKIFRVASALPDAERAELVEALLSTLAPGKEIPLDDAWLAEIDRRCAELDSGTVEAVPWSVVRERVRKKYRADG